MERTEAFPDRADVSVDDELGHRCEPQPSEGVIERDAHFEIHIPSVTPGEPHKVISLGGYGPHAAIARVMADYLFDKNSTSTNITAGHNDARHLETFLRYLLSIVQGNKEIRFGSLADLRDDVLAKYVVWLNKRMVRVGLTETPMSANSKSVRYLSVLGFLTWCRENGYVLPEYIDGIKNPWPGRHHTTESHEALSRDHLVAIRKACLQEIDVTVAKIHEGRRALASVNAPPAQSKMKAYKDLAAAIAAVHGMYPDRPMGSLAELKRRRYPLGRALNHYHDMADVSERLYLNARAIVPFLVLIAMDTYFNGSTLFALKATDISENHVIYGKDRIRITGEKNRSGRIVHRSFAAGVKDPASIVIVLDKLADVTRDFRPFVPAHLRTHLFIFARPRAGVFDAFRPSKKGFPEGWADALDQFIADHAEVEPFTLANLRASGADLAHELMGGDIVAVSRVLNHKNIQTAYTHYLDPAAKARGREAVARSMMLRERFVKSDGKSDDRDFALRDGLKSSATPGFGCVEPHYSPVVGQTAGEMCNAYGCCPACPLAWVNINDPEALHHLLQLRLSIDKGRSRVSVTRWEQVWREQIDALDLFWLRKFSRETHQAALNLRLPRIAEVE